MISTSTPILKIPSNLPVSSSGLHIYAKKYHCQLIYYDVSEKFHAKYSQNQLVVVEISPSCGVLVIVPESIPHGFSELPDFKNQIESFMEEYAFALILWQGYQKSLSQFNNSSQTGSPSPITTQSANLIASSGKMVG